MSFTKTLLATLILSCAVATSANAGLLGDTISGSYDFPSSGTTYGAFSYTVNPFVVGAGSESVLTVDGLAQTDVNFDDTSLILSILIATPFSSDSFNGPVFNIVAGNPFGSIASVLVSGGQSVTANIVGGELQVNWQGQSFNNGDTITVNFADSTVPEPATLALFGAGLAGLGAIRRRKANKA